jgi:hypothetical protein
MSVESPDDPPQPSPPPYASRAQLADYLEAQADDLEALASAEPGDPRLVAELAVRFALIAREHELTFVAERFERLAGTEAGSGAESGAGSSTGTHRS